jgi:hypothetical protein
VKKTIYICDGCDKPIVKNRLTAGSLDLCETCGALATKVISADLRLQANELVKAASAFVDRNMLLTLNEHPDSTELRVEVSGKTGYLYLMTLGELRTLDNILSIYKGEYTHGEYTDTREIHNR